MSQNIRENLQRRIADYSSFLTAEDALRRVAERPDKVTLIDARRKPTQKVVGAVAMSPDQLGQQLHTLKRVGHDYIVYGDPAPCPAAATVALALSDHAVFVAGEVWGGFPALVAAGAKTELAGPPVRPQLTPDRPFFSPAVTAAEIEGLVSAGKMTRVEADAHLAKMRHREDTQAAQAAAAKAAAEAHARHMESLAEGFRRQRGEPGSAFTPAET